LHLFSPFKEEKIPMLPDDVLRRIFWFSDYDPAVAAVCVRWRGIYTNENFSATVVKNWGTVRPNLVVSLLAEAELRTDLKDTTSLLLYCCSDRHNSANLSLAIPKILKRMEKLKATNSKVWVPVAMGCFETTNPLIPSMNPLIPSLVLPTINRQLMNDSVATDNLAIALLEWYPYSRSLSNFLVDLVDKVNHKISPMLLARLALEGKWEDKHKLELLSRLLQPTRASVSYCFTLVSIFNWSLVAGSALASACGSAALQEEFYSIALLVANVFIAAVAEPDQFSCLRFMLQKVEEVGLPPLGDFKISAQADANFMRFVRNLLFSMVPCPCPSVTMDVIGKAMRLQEPKIVEQALSMPVRYIDLSLVGAFAQACQHDLHEIVAVFLKDSRIDLSKFGAAAIQRCPLGSKTKALLEEVLCGAVAE
jgi:hypothetical protein